MKLQLNSSALNTEKKVLYIIEFAFSVIDCLVILKHTGFYKFLGIVTPRTPVKTVKKKCKANNDRC